MKIAKILSPNDLGLTGGHQAGILVPKSEEILAFFPSLASHTKNPRCLLDVEEADSGDRWTFAFIHYNNKRFGGTRDEYRLTGMTAFLRSIQARTGDELEFERVASGVIRMKLRRRRTVVGEGGDTSVLRIGNGWISIPV